MAADIVTIRDIATVPYSS